MSKGYIYKITSPTNRIYIGQTVDKKQRFDDYKKLRCETQTALYNSFIKYGFDTHTIDIIAECDSNKLNELEIHFINYFNSYRDGLNCTLGGDNGFMSGEDNISKRPEVRKKMSESKLERYKTFDAPMKGRIHKENSINIIKEKRSTQKQWRHIPVLDLQTGIYYDSIKELSNSIQVNYKCFFFRIKNTSRYKDKYFICY